MFKTKKLYPTVESCVAESIPENPSPMHIAQLRKGNPMRIVSKFIIVGYRLLVSIMYTLIYELFDPWPGGHM